MFNKDNSKLMFGLFNLFFSVYKLSANRTIYSSVIELFELQIYSSKIYW